MAHMSLSNFCPSQICVFPFLSSGPLFIWSRMLSNLGEGSVGQAMLGSFPLAQPTKKMWFLYVFLLFTFLLDFKGYWVGFWYPCLEGFSYFWHERWTSWALNMCSQPCGSKDWVFLWQANGIIITTTQIIQVGRELLLLTQEDIWEPDLPSNLPQSSSASLTVRVDKTDVK